MTLPVKIGIGALTVGAISGVSYAGSTYFMSSGEKKDEQQGTTIKALIDKEYKHILLKTSGSDDDAYWGTNWNSYKIESQKHDSDIFGLVGWNKESPTDLTDKLKEKCEDLKTKTILDNKDTNYQNVTKYCARNVTIKDQAGKEGLTIINDNNANGIWDERARNKETLSTHFTNLGIIATSGSDITADNIKSGCETAVTKNTSQNNYDVAYNSYKLVCTKK